MQIAIASGKGGVGKTTVSVSLAEYYAGKGHDVALIDCDVEEPNVNLFLGAEVISAGKAGVFVPSVDDDRCSGCGECSSLCRYSAIVLIKGKPLVLPLMCHSCGGCTLVCPEDAISEVWRAIGTVEQGMKGLVRYAGGRLNIGEPMSPPLIKEVKKIHSNASIRLYDSPPGTSCPVIESVKDADFIVLVAEPSRFGLNDLELAAGMASAIHIPFGVVVNRYVSGRDIINDYCMRENIPVIGIIPEAREIATAYSSGDCSSYINENYRGELENIATYIEENSRVVI